jgi:hypothetical protein
MRRAVCEPTFLHFNYVLKEAKRRANMDWVVPSEEAAVTSRFYRENQLT